MDIVLAASSAVGSLEMRNARLVDREGHYGAALRLDYDRTQYSRPFWFDRGDIEAFVREGRLVLGRTSGEALLRHATTSEFLCLGCAGGAWSLTGKMLNDEHPDRHVRFTFPMAPTDVERLLAACEELMRSTGAEA